MPPVKDNQWKITLVVLSLSSVLMSLSYTMLIPFLPMYLINELGVDQSRVNLWSGIVFSASFLISGVMAPVWGAMADKHSRKLMALRAAVLLAVSYGLGGIVQNEWQLLAMRCFQGFASGLWPACLAIMASFAPRDRLGFCMGTLQGALTAGGVLGPFFGGVLAEFFSMRTTFFVGGAALVVIALLILVLIKEPNRREKKAVAAKGEKRNLLRIPVVQRMLLCAGIVQLTILVQQPILPLYIGELQGSADKLVLVTGLVFSVVGISGVIASPIWGVLGEKWGYRPALSSALFGTAVFGMIQALPDTLIPFGIWRFIGGLTLAGIFPAINAVLTMSTEPEDRGRIFGLSYSAQQIGSVVGPLVGGGMAMYMPLWTVVFFSGFILLPLVIFLYLCRPKQEESSAGNPAELR